MSPSYEQDKILKTPSQIVTFENIQHKSQIVVDVRTAAEFQENSLPEAINIPLFDEMERSVIGTLYKHSGEQEAVRAGFDFANKKLNKILECFAPYKERELVISCARGGMRSRAVVNLLTSAGFKAHQLEGGYKTYRHTVIEAVEAFAPPVIVLHGLTGIGKTRLIDNLDNAIDLEGMAQHRSSLFGALDRTPNNQKCFDAELYQKIQTLGEAPYFIEGESRKIGQVYMPANLAAAMKRGKMVLVTASLPTRVQRIIEDYPMDDPEVREKARKIFTSLKRRLGSQRVNQLCTLLDEGKMEELVEILLLEYYDGRYNNCMKGYNYDMEISSENIDLAVEQLVAFREKIIAAS